MRITLVTGGARSGKSRWAVARARSLGGDAVSFVATALPSDEEMERRIRRHRAERSDAWETLEAGHEAAAALARARHPTVVLDCLTLLVSAAVLDGDAESEEEVLSRADQAVGEILEAARGREGRLLVVTNEVGMGVHPPTRLGRWFRDAQGRANQRVGREADEVVLLVSGQPVVVKAPDR
ncbi:MAG: bifunctional adenosylcobinamide kinase/adenosylcobinamide-phosphate guanylyltransferase [Gemmatimonadetes bacterium]|nr:bifunctional adenosylcobinamide kinase/adenosylcobinamide-phosphate guanylyltransferase [Gemmatimonadota bacterium]NIR76955.1 bifunctional adenosylcobinamide kinase/adenosylcobinamide-phosphate guanylyltransferase [Gemmatimonadota bacterium]NIT85484.1 bifunctional adenosylcobinamide kinase/adenosylcobinamide-phosphate guanylyltransferase [Gemmatimonadota bacterium]NIU29308.1 bifunctional adenosylcobinamide kinase/adenosylcobinamide-phosphate guanylyltransferase [Gemmatimonadota bacterium]NIU